MSGADEQIERVRKGPGVVRVVDADGKPLAGAKVTAELRGTSSSSAATSTCSTASRRRRRTTLYKQRFAELFNYATVGFYWRWYEPERGKPGLRLHRQGRRLVRRARASA